MKEVDRNFIPYVLKEHDIKSDPLVSNWLLQINAKPSTAKNYLYAIKNFCLFTGKSPNQLIEEAESEVKQGLFMRQQHVKTYILGFKQHLKNQKLAPTSVKLFMTGIRSFYRCNDIDLPDIKKENAKPLLRDIPTKEDVQAVLKVCDQLERAIILTGISSGLAINELIDLRVSDFKKGQAPDKVTTLKLRRKKVQFDFITFLSQEATEAVQTYLDFRDRITDSNHPITISAVEKQKVYSDENYVSCSNLMGFQSQEKYICFSIHLYSHPGEKNGP